ncbi:MAG TPA: 4-alpha-glucanotransferase, partial [Treponema sp.]|nr:4-alpha-glucanotransferase [Treponema sp.]
AVIPMQDILRLDNGARMNVPSTTGMNWSWRMEEGALTKENASRLAFLSSLYGRNLK